MKLFLDENVARSVVDWLRSDGHDVEWVAELAPSLPDPDVLTLAFNLRRPLLTFDVGIGPQALRRRENPPGIAILRIDMSSASAVITNFRTAWLLAIPLIRPGILLTANEHRVRARRLP